MKRVILGLVLLGCGGGGDQQAGGDTAAATPAPSAQPSSAAPAGGASIAGTVKFDGTPPANPPIDMNEEPQCKAKHGATITDPEIVVNNGNLANAFVYVKSGLPAGQAYPAASSPVVIDQDGCLYKPRVLGLQVGQDLEIRNSDPLLHNIKAVPKDNRPFNISQPTAGMKTTRKFATREVMVPLECNVHGWMNAFVGVLDHPFFAVSAEDGTFKISGLPAGTYEIEAWHEKLGTKTMSVTVGADEAKTGADVSFSATKS